MSLRVLLVNKFWYARGGAEVVAFAHDRFLQDRGHEVAHFSMAHPDNRSSPWDSYFVSNVDYEQPRARSSWRPFFSLEVRTRLRQLVDIVRPDVALLHNVYHQLGATVAFELDRLDVPMMAMLHDYKPVCPSYANMRGGAPCGECKGGRFWSAARHGCGGSAARGIVLSAEAYWQWHVLRTYQRISTYAGPSRHLIERFAALGFPSKIHYLPNSTPAMQPTVSPADNHLVGYAGRIHADKGVHLLVEVARRYPGLRFEIAGTGPALQELRREAPANIDWLGWLDRDQLISAMRRWRVAVVPSVCPENAPLSVLESMALGLPLVVTDRGGSSELAGPGALVTAPRPEDLGQAIERICADATLTTTLGRAGLARVSAEYSEKRVGDELETLLAASISRRRGEKEPREVFGRGS